MHDLRGTSAGRGLGEGLRGDPRGGLGGGLGVLGGGLGGGNPIGAVKKVLGKVSYPNPTLMVIAKRIIEGVIFDDREHAYERGVLR